MIFMNKGEIIESGEWMIFNRPKYFNQNLLQVNSSLIPISYLDVFKRFLSWHKFYCFYFHNSNFNVYFGLQFL